MFLHCKFCGLKGENDSRKEPLPLEPKEAKMPRPFALVLYDPRFVPQVQSQLGPTSGLYDGMAHAIKVFGFG